MSNEETTVPTTREEDRDWSEATSGGKLDDRYEIYLSFTDVNPVLSFDEWLR